MFKKNVSDLFSDLFQYCDPTGRKLFCFIVKVIVKIETVFIYFTSFAQAVRGQVRPKVFILLLIDNYDSFYEGRYRESLSFF